MWFSKKKELKSEEYETLSNKLVDLRAEVKNMVGEVVLLRTECNNLRGQFNRKLAGLAKEEEKVAPKEEEKPKDLNKPEPKVFTGMQYVNNL